jgi:hypothetical protein
MRVATLISWLLTAGLGSFMLHAWLDRGGLHRARERPGGLPPALIFGHAAGALVGLLLWAAYLAAGTRPLAWAAVGALMVTVALGLCTVTLWTPYPARRPGERRPGERRPGEQLPGGQPDARWDVPVEVVPDTVAALVSDAQAAGPAAADDPYQVTDEMIARLLADSFPRRQSRQIRPDPAVIVPIAHGFAAIATFVLAVMSAIM